MSEDPSGIINLFSWLVSQEGSRYKVPEEKPVLSQKIERKTKYDQLLDFADQIETVLRQHQGASMCAGDLLNGELPDHFKDILGLSTPEESTQPPMMQASKILSTPSRELAHIYGYEADQDVNCPHRPIQEEYMVWILKDLRNEAWERAREFSGKTRFYETEISNYYHSSYPISQIKHSRDL